MNFKILLSSPLNLPRAKNFSLKDGERGNCDFTLSCIKTQNSQLNKMKVDYSIESQIFT